MTWFGKIVRLWPWLAAVSSGLLYAGCFAPFDKGWLCWIALTPLLAAVWFSGADSKRRWLRDLLLGYVSGLTFFTITFYWLSSLGTLFQNAALHGIPALLATYMGVYPAAWAWIAGRIRPHEAGLTEQTGKWDEMLARAGQPVSTPPSSPWLKSSVNLRLAFCLASVWVVLEWTRGWLLGGFGWNGLGVALHANWPIIQIAEFTGLAGLSFVVVFVNVIGISTVWRLILEARERKMRPHYDFTLTMAGIVGLLGFGLHAVQSKQPTQRIRVAAIQPDIAQAEKFDPQFTDAIFEKYAHLTEIAVRTSPPPDLIVWPESSMPDPVREEGSMSHRFVTDFLAANKADLLLGTMDVEGSAVYNAALLASASHPEMQVYRKLHLVPFGEYVPLRPLFGAFASSWVPSDFDFGTEPIVFQLTRENVRPAPLICFEDTVGDLVRLFVLKGANLLVNVTNDGWFLKTVGAQQHVPNALFRCVETRRPMVRAANTGVTCFINQFGRITDTLRDDVGSTFTEGILTGDVDVPTGNELTFYVRHGEIFTKACVGITFLILLSLAPRILRRRPG